MANIAKTNDWSLDPFGINDYFGAGGAGGAGGTGTKGSLGTLGAALTAAIIKYKETEKTKNLHLPESENTTQNEVKTETNENPSIPSDLAEPGVQVLPYLPNAGKEKETENEKNKDIIPPTSEGIPNTEIKDETDTNVESVINPGFDMQSMYDFIINQQQRQWDREDAIRKETQEREDSAYQRAVADAKKAGINVNLMGINPAQSGGGITSATGLDYSPWTAEINKQLALLEQEIANSFQGDENAKDRFTKGLTSLLQLFAMFALKS